MRHLMSDFVHFTHSLHTQGLRKCLPMSHFCALFVKDTPSCLFTFFNKKKLYLFNFMKFMISTLVCTEYIFLPNQILVSVLTVGPPKQE